MTDETIRKLRDPVAVHIAMLRGEIAVPPLAELLHVYGATFSNLDAANVELAKARETIRQLRAQLDEYEREKLKRESQEPVAFRWLGPGKGWLPVYAEPPVPHVDPDWLQSLIRQEIGGCSRELAEKIAQAINGRRNDHRRIAQNVGVGGESLRSAD
ncbi:MAG: hypothetical protein AELANPGJ_02057 [Anaerolineae bacterium]|nr:hypothetical protein [Anaerolineae bacterium]